MIVGIHALIHAQDAEATRTFLSKTLGLRAVDAGEGWLIFRLPPAELGVHPADKSEAGRHQLSIMCDDIEATVAELEQKGVKFTSPIADRGWGLVTILEVPGGGTMMLYQPRHKTAIALDGSSKRSASPRKTARKERTEGKSAQGSSRSKTSKRRTRSSGRSARS